MVVLGVDDYPELMRLWTDAGLGSLRPSGRDSQSAFTRADAVGVQAVFGIRAAPPPMATADALGAAGHVAEVRARSSSGPRGAAPETGLVPLVAAVLASHDGRKGWINRLAVQPEYRRRGLARRLVAAAEAWLDEQGIEIVAALIEADNPVSLKLFQEIGYTAHDIVYVSRRRRPDA